MCYFATEIHEPATPLSTDPGRARQHPVCGQKPLRGPIHKAISGYRYLNPELGRWMSKDPIEERGGLNVYGVLGKDFVGFTVYLGLRTIISKSNPEIRELDVSIFYVSDQLDLTPQAGRAGFYNPVVAVLGAGWHSLLGVSKNWHHVADWEESLDISGSITTSSGVNSYTETANYNANWE